MSLIDYRTKVRRDTLGAWSAVAALCLTIGSASLGAQSAPPRPVRLAWGGSASRMETGALRIDEGEEVQISLTGYLPNENYADLAYYRPTYAVGDAKILQLEPSPYPHVFNVKGVGSGTTWLSAESAGLRIVLPVIAGRAKELTVAEDLPPQFRVGRVKINVPESKVGMGSLRLAVGEEVQLGVEALVAQSMQRAALETFPVTWVSSDPSVVQVGSWAGTPISHHVMNVVGRRSGSATLTASVQGVKAVLPVLVGTARSAGKAAAGQANTFSTSRAPFATSTPAGPAVGDADAGSAGVVLRAPEVFGAKTYRLQRSQPGAGASEFVDVATDFRLERGAVVMTDSTAPGTRDAGPALYRVVAIDHAGKVVTGQPTAVLTDGAALAGATIRRGPGGAELTWAPAPGAKYKVARFAGDGSGWTTFDATAGTYRDPSPPAGAAYVLLALDGDSYAQYGPTLRLR
jgi:hypothetical protein